MIVVKTEIICLILKSLYYYHIHYLVTKKFLVIITMNFLPNSLPHYHSEFFYQNYCYVDVILTIIHIDVKAIHCLYFIELNKLTLRGLTE